MSTTIGKWGPGVIGPEKYAEEKEIKRIGAHKWGPGVTGGLKVPARTEYEKLDYNELRAAAKEKGISFPSSPTKAELLVALQKASTA